jgi:hypothetical protein
MKRTLSVVLFTIVAAVSGIAGPAWVYSYEVNVPFDFVANGRTVHAGKVVVECDAAVVRLLTPENKAIAVLPSRGTGVTPNQGPLYFKRVGWNLQLAGVRDPATGKVRVL